MSECVSNLQQSTKVSSFVCKLQQILGDPDNSPDISWEQDGKSFSITNVKKFEDELLPRYFRHSRMSSFVRQLNMYGFHKVRTSTDLIVFSHKSFHKENLENVVIIRKPQSQTSPRKPTTETITSTPPTKQFLEDPNSLEDIEYGSNQQITDQPLSDLVLSLVEEVSKENLILDCDIKAKVHQLLRQEPYSKLCKKFMPFILNSLGVDSQPSLRNIGSLSLSSHLLLMTHNFIESLKFIL